tara:strand:- start:182 stop:1117 length:936 start_codon:yes stop_codon:yes gene_type:complete
MKKIIITGGCGFIGSHIVEQFIDKNYEITVVDLWQSPEIRELSKDKENLKFEKLDVNDYAKLEKLISNNEYFIHLAAILGTSETITTYDIEDVVKTNILGTTKILKMTKKYNYKKVVVPTTPDVTWLNPYKITKGAVEKIAQLFNKEYGLNVSCLKLGNIYGSRERWLEADLNAPFNYQKVVPSFIMDTLSKNEVIIYGDGLQKSEYIYVKDVSESFFRIIDKEVNTGTDVVHVGSGKNHSVLDIVSSLEKAWGKKINKKFVTMRPGEHKIEINLDPKNLKKYLDYELQWDLIKGLKETIPYYLEQHKRQN